MKKKYDDLQGNLLEYCIPQETERKLSPQEQVRIGKIPKNAQVREKDVFDEDTREMLRNAGYDGVEMVSLWYS